MKGPADSSLPGHSQSPRGIFALTSTRPYLRQVKKRLIILLEDLLLSMFLLYIIYYILFIIYYIFSIIYYVFYYILLSMLSIIYSPFTFSFSSSLSSFSSSSPCLSYSLLLSSTCLSRFMHMSAFHSLFFPFHSLFSFTYFKLSFVQSTLQM